MLLRRSTIQLLRLHFSFFLFPVYLFALAEAPHIDIPNAVLIFFILHLLVYPASNGYNSYMDRDETPIGGLAKPLQPTQQLFYTTVVMDVMAVLLSLFISLPFAAGILLYILASRAYSWRKIRLKTLPFTGFLTVFFFQGAMIFFVTYHGVALSNRIPVLPAFISSLLIGALYPLTQVYQHKEDREDGVTTISMKLGIRGTFLFTAFLFLAATFLFFLKFESENRLSAFYIYTGVMTPVLIYFFYWLKKVWQKDEAADFRHSLLMSTVATLFTTIFFIILITLSS